MDTLTTVTGKKYDEAFFKNPDPALQKQLDAEGILVLEEFVSPEALTLLKKEAALLKPGAYRSESVYNLFVMPEDASLPEDSPRNRQFKTTKGCIADDEVPKNSALRTIYDSPLFREFICKLEGLPEIFPYADALSSININYYDEGDSLEWHFDNADFAITLLLKQCDEGGVYEYVPNVRYTKDGKEDYDALANILDGKTKPLTADMPEGTLMLFRGNRSVHRVTPITKGDRVLVTLNYNVKPGIPLSEKSRKTFFGRIGVRT